MQTSPPDQKFPRIVSRLHTLENESKICRQAFPPGKYFTVPPLPNVTAVNALGDFSIARDRLAIIDGEGVSARHHLSILPSPSITPCSTFGICLSIQYNALPLHAPLFCIVAPLHLRSSMLGLTLLFPLHFWITLLSVLRAMSILRLTAPMQLTPGDP